MKYKSIFENQNKMMKTHLIVMIITILPLFVNAQTITPSTFIPPKPTMESHNPFNWWKKKYPDPLPTATVKHLNWSKLAKAETKLAKEERKLMKLVKRTWVKENDLKKAK